MDTEDIMTRIIALTLGIAALTGCVFVDPSPPVHHDPVVVVTNSPRNLAAR